MSKKPHILIVNDDGIHAPGIKHLWKALFGKADISIIAPASEQSGMSVAFTSKVPLHIRPVAWEENTPAWSVSGTPADCIRLGTSVILDRAPDLIVSGINKGDNSGRSVLFSGTVGGVIEGVLRGIPGIAFSCEEFDNPDYAIGEKYIYSIVKHVLEQPLPQGSFLNVTFPALGEIKGFKLTRQGKRYWKEEPQKGLHPEGHHYYWLGGTQLHVEEHEESDVAMLKEGYLTATPIHVEELTDYSVLKTRKELFENIYV